MNVCAVGKLKNGKTEVKGRESKIKCRWTWPTPSLPSLNCKQLSSALGTHKALPVSRLALYKQRRLPLFSSNGNADEEGFVFLPLNIPILTFHVTSESRGRVWCAPKN